MRVRLKSVPEEKRCSTRFKKSSNFDSVVRWDVLVAEKVMSSGDWMI